MGPPGRRSFWTPHYVHWKVPEEDGGMSKIVFQWAFYRAGGDWSNLELYAHAYLSQEIFTSHSLHLISFAGNEYSLCWMAFWRMRNSHLPSLFWIVIWGTSTSSSIIFGNGGEVNTWQSSGNLSCTMGHHQGSSTISGRHHASWRREPTPMSVETC